MRTVIPPHYLELVADAALNSYWRKRALALFLKRCGVKESFLATWAGEESKRDILYRLFPRLEESGDVGLRLVNRMADALIQQTSFPDLVGWEDSKQKIANATSSVDALRTYRNAQQAQAATEKEKAEAKKRAAEINAEARARAADLTKLEDELTELSKQLGSTSAGYAFQDWFYKLADYFEVTNRRPYVVNGRQIDGSITIDGTTYLVELKFTREQSDAVDIDSLLAKVSGKADNTMGVMFSISGYSSVAIQGASGPKGLLLLFDHNHLYMLLHGGASMEELICRVRRHASQTGEAYLSPRYFNE
ncbi:MAG TPA: hypothetical protein VGN44_10250 [Candidatus Angelobacter sp.]